MLHGCPSQLPWIVCCNILNFISKAYIYICIYIHMCICISLRTKRIFSGDKIEKNEMSGAYSTYGVEERRIQGFGGET